MKNKIPKFKNEAAERAFWATHDSTDYVDWKKGKNVNFPKRSNQETLHLLSIPGMRASIRAGLKAPVRKLSKKLAW